MEINRDLNLAYKRNFLFFCNKKSKLITHFGLYRDNIIIGLVSGCFNL